MDAWELLDRASEDATWDRLESSFGFRPSTTAFPVVTEPTESVTYDVSGAYGDKIPYWALTLDLCERLVEAMRRCVGVDGAIHVFDWQHPSYRFWPHRRFEFTSEDDWPIPPLPNGDYYLFLDPELRFGVIGHPWEQSMCVFGEALVRAFEERPPQLFGTVLRKAGRRPGGDAGA